MKPGQDVGGLQAYSEQLSVSAVAEQPLNTCWLGLTAVLGAVATNRDQACVLGSTPYYYYTASTNHSRIQNPFQKGSCGHVCYACCGVSSSLTQGQVSNSRPYHCNTQLPFETVADPGASRGEGAPWDCRPGSGVPNYFKSMHLSFPIPLFLVNLHKIQTTNTSALTLNVGMGK